MASNCWSAKGAAEECRDLRLACGSLLDRCQGGVLAFRSLRQRHSGQPSKRANKYNFEQKKNKESDRKSSGSFFTMGMEQRGNALRSGEPEGGMRATSTSRKRPDEIVTMPRRDEYEEEWIEETFDPGSGCGHALHQLQQRGGCVSGSSSVGKSRRRIDSSESRLWADSIEPRRRTDSGKPGRCNGGREHGG